MSENSYNNSNKKLVENIQVGNSVYIAGEEHPWILTSVVQKDSIWQAYSSIDKKDTNLVHIADIIEVLPTSNQIVPDTPEPVAVTPLDAPEFNRLNEDLEKLAEEELLNIDNQEPDTNIESNTEANEVEMYTGKKRKEQSRRAIPKDETEEFADLQDIFNKQPVHGFNLPKFLTAHEKDALISLCKLGHESLIEKIKQL